MNQRDDLQPQYIGKDLDAIADQIIAQHGGRPSLSHSAMNDRLRRPHTMTGDPPTARAVRDHKALAALDQYCKNEKGGAFASLSEADKDAIIDALESRAAKLDSINGQAFFELVLENVR